MTPTKFYEPGMKIIFDLHTRSAKVSFRGKISNLGTFESEEYARSAGEAFCRKHGWAGPPLPQAPKSLLAHRHRPIL